MLMQKLLAPSRRNLSLRDPALNAYYESFGGATASGQHINENTALKISIVYACVRVISETLSSLPCFVYQRLAVGKARATNHSVFNLVKNRPNSLMTSVELIQTLQAHLLLWGNAFCEIIRNGSGNIASLWPWRPDRVRLQLFAGKVYYYYTDPLTGAEQQYTQDQVLHLRGLGSDGILGYSVISLLRESMGLCSASQEYRARFFRNDARPGGVFQHPGKLSPEAHNNLRGDLERQFTGENRRSVAILEDGLQWKDVGIPPNDAQFVEGWQAQKEDIAAAYRVPAYKVGIMKPGTVSHSSVEQANLDFWTDCIRCWAVLWESRLEVSLFTEAEQRIYFVEFLGDAILRSDAKSRAETLQIWRNNGIINADDWLELENRNPLPDNKGKAYWMPFNMGEVGNPQAPRPARPALPGAPPARSDPSPLNGHAN